MLLRGCVVSAALYHHNFSLHFIFDHAIRHYASGNYTFSFYQIMNKICVCQYMGLA